MKGNQSVTISFWVDNNQYQWQQSKRAHFICVVMSPRRHLFTYKLTTKQNKDHNQNVKSNRNCHIFVSLASCTPQSCNGWRAVCWVVGWLVRWLLPQLLLSFRFVLSVDICLPRLLSISVYISVFMSLDIIVKCFQMVVPWHFIASDTHQFSIHFMYHFYCLHIRIAILSVKLFRIVALLPISDHEFDRIDS